MIRVAIAEDGFSGSPVVGGTVAGFLAPVLASCSLLGVVAAVLTGFTGHGGGFLSPCYRYRWFVTGLFSALASSLQ
ncbi:hypothetical protein ACSBR2_042626 [Camellia fascicularis]